MPDTTVKYFHSAMPGAPVLSGTAGALIAVLDACLVNGFAVSAVASLVVAGNVATATISAGHSAEVGSVVLVSGATPSGLNGEKKVLSVGSGNTTLTYDAPGIADQTATGTISLKMAPAGWSKTVTATYQAAYKSNNVAATGCQAWFSDTADQTARCRGFEWLNSGTDQGPTFPVTAQGANGVYLAKSNAASSSPRPWTLIADDRIFYLLVAYHATYPLGGQFCGFGDLAPVKSGDAWSFMVSGYASDLSGSAPGNTNDLGVLRAAADPLFLARSYTAVGSSAQGFKAFPLLVPSTSTGFASGAGPMPYPNGPDSGLYLTPLNVFETPWNVLRGAAPGLFCCPQSLPLGVFAANARIAAVDNLIGREIRVVPFGAGSGTAGFAFFDTTGPWR